MAALLRPPSLRPGMLASTCQAVRHACFPVSLPAIPACASAWTSIRRNSSLPTFRTDDTADVEVRAPKPFRREKERHVLLQNLPTSATPLDIRSLARETKTRNDLGRIEFLYTRLLLPSGKAILRFSSDIHARNFEGAAHGRILGGRQLRAQVRSASACDRLLQDTYGRWPADYQLPFDLIEYESGKLVLLRNIPQDTYEARLEERLGARYDLRLQDRWRGTRTSFAGWLNDRKGHGGSHDVVLGGVVKLSKAHPDASTTSFIIRCETTSEAARLVRRWHNTYFAPATFDIQDTAGRYRVAASILY